MPDAGRTSVDAPFNNADPQGYFACTTHDATYRSLLDGVHMHEGCVVLSGEAGAGKTLLLRKLVREASSSALRLAYCPTGALDFDQLLTFVCDELGLNVQAPDRSDSLAVFKQYLGACYDANTVFVLIVDDAHMLREEVVDQLLALTRSGSMRRGLRLVLCGSPALLDRLSAWRIRYPALASAFLVHLPRLSKAETTALIKYRLEVGVAGIGLAFSDPAIECIAHHAHGIPGVVDALCQRALALARRDGETAISDKTVSQAAAELDKKAEPLVFKQPEPMPVSVSVSVPASPAEEGAVAVKSDQAHTRTRETGRILSLRPTAMPLLVALLAPAVVGGWYYFYSDKDVSAVSSTESLAPQAMHVMSDEPVAGTDLGLDSLVATVVSDEPVAKAVAVTRPELDYPVVPVASDEPVAEADLEAAIAPEIAFVEEPAEEPVLDADLQFWGQIKDSQDPKLYQDYLDAFPQGQFAKLAEFRLQRFTEPPADELDTLIAKARVALENNALTTPAENSAVKWAEAALQLDPQHEAARDVLNTVIDTYLEWSLQNFERRRFSSASNYLQRARTLEDHASDEQLAAIDVLDKQVSSERDRAARLQAKRAARQQAKRARSTRNSSRSRNTVSSAEAWFNQIDRDLQSLGQKIRREANAFGQSTALSREQGYNSAR